MVSSEHDPMDQVDPLPADLADSADQPHRGKTPGDRASSRASLAPAVIVTVIVIVILGLSLWFLVQPQPLIVQGETDATRIDVAARVEGRISERPVERGDDIDAGKLLFRIANPELITKLKVQEATKTAALANLANINAGTRAEETARRKASFEASEADLTLAQQTYDRTKQMVSTGSSPLQKFDDATNALQVATRTSEQANLAYQEATNGYTLEQRNIAEANVAQAQASIETAQADVDEMIVRAPAKAQVYQIGAEIGEYVSPGVPLLSLVVLDDVWLKFDLREDLVQGLKVGDQFKAHVPALGNREITAIIKLIAAKGEYASWRATRATGDFDLRTFEVRAYPVSPIPELRPGMSVYAFSPGAQK